MQATRGRAKKSTVSQKWKPEQVFFNKPLLMVEEDEKHSKSEPHFHDLGRTSDNRLLHITFTLRAEGTQIRVISARNVHRKERAFMSKIPEFKTEAEERVFWENHDSTPYLDWSQAESISMPNLKHQQKPSPCACLKVYWKVLRSKPINGICLTSP